MKKTFISQDNEGLTDWLSDRLIDKEWLKNLTDRIQVSDREIDQQTDWLNNKLIAKLI